MAAPLALLTPLLKSMAGAVAGKAAAAKAAVAAPQAAQAVAARTAVQAGAEKAVAAQVLPTPGKAAAALGNMPKPTGGGGFVLEDPSTALSAKQLTAQLQGGQAAASATPAASAPASAAPVTPPIRPTPQLPTAQQLPPVRAQTPAAELPRAQRLPPVRPDRAAPTPEPRQKGPFESTVDRFQKWREKRASVAAEQQKLQTPVTQQTRGMSWPQRAERLAEGDRLLSKEQVTQRTGIEGPKQNDIIRESERSEEEDRVKRLETLNQEMEALDAPLKAVSKGMMVLGGTAGAGGVLLGVGKGLVSFSRSVTAANDGLRRFDPAIAASAAQMEKQDLVLRAQMARSTSGTATAANKAWMDMRAELTDFHQTVKTGINIAAVASSETVEWGAWLAKLDYRAKGVLAGLNLIEGLLGDDDKDKPRFYQAFIADVEVEARERRRPPDFDRGGD